MEPARRKSPQKIEQDAVALLIEQLESMEAGDHHYDAKVTVLGELIDHHVWEKRDSMSQKARAAEIGLVELGAQLLQRKEDLQGN